MLILFRLLLLLLQNARFGSFHQYSGTPIWTQKYYHPRYGDPQKGTPKFGNSSFSVWVQGLELRAKARSAVNELYFHACCIKTRCCGPNFALQSRTPLLPSARRHVGVSNFCFATTLFAPMLGLGLGFYGLGLVYWAEGGPRLNMGQDMPPKP